MSRECGFAVCALVLVSVCTPVSTFTSCLREGYEGLLFRLGNKMDVKVFGSLLVDFPVRERRQRSSFGPLRQTVGGGGAEDVAGSN